MKNRMVKLEKSCASCPHIEVAEGKWERTRRQNVIKHNMCAAAANILGRDLTSRYGGAVYDSNGILVGDGNELLCSADQRSEERRRIGST